jgi:hypothetical protein
MVVTGAPLTQTSLPQLASQAREYYHHSFAKATIVLVMT